MPGKPARRTLTFERTESRYVAPGTISPAFFRGLSGACVAEFRTRQFYTATGTSYPFLPVTISSESDLPFRWLLVVRIV